MYLIECCDSPESPDAYWYILGSSHTQDNAQYHADRYRRMLYANGCQIRVTHLGKPISPKQE